ncbi:UNVERIFIED_CONTAM: cellulose synthase/poly-beta-1,6-N-acetylglucosamine synthase-like glycosyltransferase [Williamsia faeni]
MADSRIPQGVRLARLWLLTLVLFGLALALMAVGAWFAWQAQPTHDDVGYVPVGVAASVPPASVIFGAGAVVTGCFFGLTALHAAATIRVLARDRRIPAPLPAEMRRMRRIMLTPLGPSAMRLVTAEPDLPPSQLPEPSVASVAALHLTVLVPAHNERLTIGATLESLWTQTRPPDRVVVVADNCNDNTADIARHHGAEVFTTVANTDKKAGGLNQALSEMFSDIDVRDIVMVMDADSVIVPEFLDTAMARLEADTDLIAVGGVFYGESGSGLVGQLQRNEYARYGRAIGRRHGKVFVLTGTASLFRAYALKAVADSRGSLIPGDTGKVYDTSAMTEDNELTLALKSLGAKMVSPMQCRVTTELMPTWRSLWRQRMRWQRGALENIGAYGLTRATLRYWLQQLGIGYGTIALNAYLLLMLITLLSASSIELPVFWISVGSIFLVERVVTVWSAGWRGRLVAVPLVVEIAYDLVLQAVYVTSLFAIAAGREAGWNYVPREAVAQ